MTTTQVKVATVQRHHGAASFSFFEISLPADALVAAPPSLPVSKASSRKAAAGGASAGPADGSSATSDGTGSRADSSATKARRSKQSHDDLVPMEPIPRPAEQISSAQDQADEPADAGTVSQFRRRRTLQPRRGRTPSPPAVPLINANRRTAPAASDPPQSHKTATDISVPIPLPPCYRFPRQRFRILTTATRMKPDRGADDKRPRPCPHRSDQRSVQRSSNTIVLAPQRWHGSTPDEGPRPFPGRRFTSFSASRSRRTTPCVTTRNQPSGALNPPSDLGRHTVHRPVRSAHPLERATDPGGAAGRHYGDPRPAAAADTTPGRR